MRNQWRSLLILRHYSRSQPHISTLSRSQVQSIGSISTTLVPCSRWPCLPFYQSFIRFFSSSEIAVEAPANGPSDSNHIAVLTDIFSKTLTTNETIKMELEANNVVITHDLVLSTLKNLQSAPVVARRFFKWISKSGSENEKRLCSKSYNLMLGILVENGFVREFWDMVRIMKKKGYGVSKVTFNKASEKLQKDGLSNDMEKLKELYASGSTDTLVKNICSRVCRVIRQDVWGNDVEKRLSQLNVKFSSDLVSMVVENIGIKDNKGLIFFRWVEESGCFKHDERTFNAMARVLASEDSSEKFWRLVDEMKNAGYEMDKDTYVMILERFVKKRMIKDAVDLYEFAMGGLNKPALQDCTFLLKKIVVSKEMDLNLFSRVVRTFRENENILTNVSFNAVLKSLRSIGRIGEFNKILKSIEGGDLLPSDSLQRKIAFQLSRGGKSEEASEFMENMEASEPGPDYKTWTSFVEGYCLAGDLAKALTNFQKMVEKVGASTTGHALDTLVSAYCHNNRAVDAYNLVSKMVNEKELHPWHSTYKILVVMLLSQGGFKEALNILPLMKSQGYPPFLEPFIEYLSKSGSPDDATIFTKAMTVKRFPSAPVFLQLFEAFLKVGRHNEAQDFLLKCPKLIRNHADVLNLFCSMKSGDRTPAATIAA